MKILRAYEGEGVVEPTYDIQMPGGDVRLRVPESVVETLRQPAPTPSLDALSLLTGTAASVKALDPRIAALEKALEEGRAAGAAAEAAAVATVAALAARTIALEGALTEIRASTEKAQASVLADLAVGLAALRTDLMAQIAKAAAQQDAREKALGTAVLRALEPRPDASAAALLVAVNGLTAAVRAPRESTLPDGRKVTTQPRGGGS